MQYILHVINRQKQVNMVITDEVDNIGGNNPQQKQVTRRKQLPLKPYPAPQPPFPSSLSENENNSQMNGRYNNNSRLHNIGQKVSYIL